jgi:4-hydroxybenzoate polyprenyltransferase
MFNIRDQIKDKIAGRLLKIIGFAQGSFLFLFLLSPFIWIWHSWEMAWKTGLTGFLGILALKVAYKIVNVIVDEAIDEVINRKKSDASK